MHATEEGGEEGLCHYASMHAISPSIRSSLASTVYRKGAAWQCSLEAGWWRRPAPSPVQLAAVSGNQAVPPAVTICTAAMAAPRVQASPAPEGAQHVPVVVFQFYHNRWALQTDPQDPVCPWYLVVFLFF